MRHYFNKLVNGVEYSNVLAKTIEEINKAGFQIISTTDFKQGFKEKLNKDRNEYTVLGVCDMKLALEAVESEELLGLVIPCNVLVRCLGGDKGIEVAIADPQHSFSVFSNKNVTEVADKLQDKLVNIINSI